MYATGVLVGFCFFLIGAQMPYSEFCAPSGFPCHARTLIDLTHDRHVSNDLEIVVSWYARLATVLVAGFIMYRSQVSRLRAAGFVAFTSLIALALYPFYVAPSWLAARAWEPGAALWPIGAGVMLISAMLSARIENSAGRSVTTADGPRLVVMLLGAALSAASVTVPREAALYLLPLGVAGLVWGFLRTRDDERASSESKTIERARWLGAPLLVGSALVVASYFVSWGIRAGPSVPIRLEFLFSLDRDDFWLAVFVLTVIAGAVVASLHLVLRGTVSRFLIGAAAAGAVWMVPVVARIGRGELHTVHSEQPGSYVLAAGVLLMLATAIFTGEPRRRHGVDRAHETPS